MPTRHANATWTGGLKSGKGTVKLESGAYEGPYDFKSRFEEGPLTNPEELVGAAHAGCYTMFLSSLLEKNGTVATNLETKAAVTLGDGPTITKIVLSVVGTVPNIVNDKFQELAKEAKAKCPVSKALASVPEIVLEATLKA